MLFDL